MSFRALSINHNTAPVEVRERVAILGHELENYLEDLSIKLEVNDLLVLSTCNRTEIYYTLDSDLSDYLIQDLAKRKGVNAKELGKVTTKMRGEQAARHLYRVSLGLESQVLGDLQIINQVKKAYQASANAELAGPYLHRLMHTIFYTNKQVVQQTSFRDGAASVSYAAYEMACDFTSHLPEAKVLVVGLGEIGRDVARNFSESHQASLFVCNRTASKAEAMQQETGCSIIPWEELSGRVHEFDIIINSIGLDQPIVHPKQFLNGYPQKYRYFFDLGIPRGIDQEIEEVPGAVLYNIDEINTRTKETLERRKESIAEVEMLMEEGFKGFSEWSKEMQFSPVLQQLKAALEEIREEELEKYAKKHSPEELELANKITKSLLKQIMKKHALHFKAACRRGEAETLVESLQGLFNLEKESAGFGE